jgi:hypothetical protein
MYSSNASKVGENIFKMITLVPVFYIGNHFRIEFSLIRAVKSIKDLHFWVLETVG